MSGIFFFCFLFYFFFSPFYSGFLIAKDRRLGDGSICMGWIYLSRYRYRSLVFVRLPGFFGMHSAQE